MQVHDGISPVLQRTSSADLTPVKSKHTQYANLQLIPKPRDSSEGKTCYRGHGKLGYMWKSKGLSDTREL